MPTSKKPGPKITKQPATATPKSASAALEGKKAPAFELLDADGKTVALKQLLGANNLVLYFYPKDMTQGCTIEAHNFQRDLAQYEAKNAVIVGVSEDTVDSHVQFCTKESLTFKLLSDASHEVAPRYGSVMEMRGMQLAARNTFIIDPKGVIRKVYLKVNPTPHSTDVLSDLPGLQKSATD